MSQVDVLFLFDVYAAGEEVITGADTKSLCRAIRIRGQVDPIYVEKKSDIESYLKSVVEDDDIILFLGAGDIGSLAADFVNKLSVNVH